MDLQISVFLLFILFTTGHSLSCYECKGENNSCADQTELTCHSGSTHCESLTAVTQVGDITYKEKSKNCVSFCQSGSRNFGTVRLNISCCNTDLCNLQDAELSTVTNGKKCYYCDGQICSNTVSCSGDEDHCITVSETSGNHTMVSKGCVSKSICDATTSVRTSVVRVSCCEGNLCNGAQSVSQSFLFLCCSLLSYFLLH